MSTYKLCRGRRRPLAEKTGGIGIWEHLLHIVAVVSVLTNCWLVGFTTETFKRIGDVVGQVGLFGIIVGWEHIMLLIKYIMQNSISPLPISVKDALKREQHNLELQRSESMMQARRQQHQREEVHRMQSQRHLDVVLSTQEPSVTGNKTPLARHPGVSRGFDNVAV